MGEMMIFQGPLPGCGILEMASRASVSPPVGILGGQGCDDGKVQKAL